MRIISIANQKGGCGKTTTAINLSSSLALNGKRVLLIDMDPQSHATLGLNIESDASLYNVISKLTPKRMKLEEIVRQVSENFDIIPSNILVGTLEQELADEIGRELKLSEAINQSKDQYDYILIDCPPSLGFLTVNALRASQEVIIPVEPSRFSLQGVDRLIDIVNLIKDRLNHQVACRILITIFDSRLRYSFSMLENMKEQFGDMLFTSMIHVNVKLKESVMMGETVVSYDKYCRGSKDYLSLAKEVISAKTPAGAKEFKDFSSVMQGLVKEKSRELVQTAFHLNCPEAGSVYVTGSFNNWSLDESCRMKRENGLWKIDLPLETGVYQYRFIVDGNWREDPENPLQERNAFGDVNSLVKVENE